MSGHASPQTKLARAARLQAEAAKLYAEAAEELERQAPQPPPSEITEIDRARARRGLTRIGR